MQVASDKVFPAPGPVIGNFGCDDNSNWSNYELHNNLIPTDHLWQTKNLAVETDVPRPTTRDTVPSLHCTRQRPCPEPQGGLSNLFVAAHEFKSKSIVCIIK